MTEESEPTVTDWNERRAAQKAAARRHHLAERERWEREGLEGPVTSTWPPEDGAKEDGAPA